MPWRPKKLQIAASLLFLLIILIVVRTSSPTNPMTTESGRVQYSFKTIFSVLEKEGGVSTQLHLPPVRVDVVSYPDGSKASLWVPNSAILEPRANCFAVDVVRDNSGSAGFFESSCLKPKSEVILERQGPVVVGYVRMTKAHFATINSGGVRVDAPITYGYFIFPSVVSEDPKAKFAISFIDPGGATCKVVDLPAPGNSASVECVIA